MLHWLRFSRCRLVPVLRHKSNVAYSSSAVRRSSPAEWTSNLENQASRSMNNQQALMGSISLCYLPSIAAMSWWKRSPCSSLAEPQFSGKKSRWEPRKWPYPFDIVMCLVSAVPLKQETRKCCVPELQSKQKCNDFQVCTNVPLVCVIHTLCIAVTASCYHHFL